MRISASSRIMVVSVGDGKAGLDYYIFPQALRASPRLRFCFVRHRMKSLQDEPVLCCTNDYAGRSRISISDRVFAWVCTRAFVASTEEATAVGSCTRRQSC